MQRLADRIVEMGAERIDGDALAGNVLDLLDGAVFQHVEDRLDLGIDAVRRIGGDEVVAADDRVQHGGGGRAAEFHIAGGERDQRGRTAGGITDIFDRDAGSLEITEFGGKFMGGKATLAGEIAQVHVLGEGHAGKAEEEGGGEEKFSRMKGHGGVL
jgi:hypothetical protein